jgi:hypothetical protein
MSFIVVSLQKKRCHNTNRENLNLEFCFPDSYKKYKLNENPVTNVKYKNVNNLINVKRLVSDLSYHREKNQNFCTRKKLF